MKKRKNAWRWWAKALGEKASKCDKESDRIALIRTVIFATYLITNCFIVAGVIRHWNDSTQDNYDSRTQDRLSHLEKTKCTDSRILSKLY